MTYAYVPPTIPTTPLISDEQDRVAILLGYSRSNLMVYNATSGLNVQQIIVVRSSIAEIDRLELLIKQAATQLQAVKVEDIQLNMSYRNDLRFSAATEVEKIAITLQLPIFYNFYSAYDGSPSKYKDAGTWGYILDMGGDNSGPWGGVSAR